MPDLTARRTRSGQGRTAVACYRSLEFIHRHRDNITWGALADTGCRRDQRAHALLRHAGAAGRRAQRPSGVRPPCRSLSSPCGNELQGERRSGQRPRDRLGDDRMRYLGGIARLTAQRFRTCPQAARLRGPSSQRLILRLSARAALHRFDSRCAWLGRRARQRPPPCGPCALGPFCASGARTAAGGIRTCGIWASIGSPIFSFSCLCARSLGSLPIRASFSSAAFLLLRLLSIRGLGGLPEAEQEAYSHAPSRSSSTITTG